jgi:hypothetical protein
VHVSTNKKEDQSFFSRKNGTQYQWNIWIMSYAEIIISAIICTHKHMDNQNTSVLISVLD